MAETEEPLAPLDAYRARIASSEIRQDPGQELAVTKLQSLYFALQGYRPAQGKGGRGFFGWSRRTDDTPPPNGLYVYGEVGRGKSMLMDLFFGAAPVAQKRRVHFHAFMQEIHGRLHAWRQATKDDRSARDPMPKIAEQVAAETWLLCFDEFVVNNIADAMILGRLFEALFERGVIVVATSNFAPDDLYKDGLQRDRFTPFIALIKERMDVLQLEGAQDYRLVRLKGLPTYYTPRGAAAAAELERAFRRLADGETGAPDSVEVQGRSVPVQRAANGVAWFSFDDLCERPLGPADYLAIARSFHSVVLADVPVMGPERRNEARRFITLIDALYEHKVTLICSADAPPHHLYASGEGANEFLRTVSRMVEMQSEHYQAQPHAGAAA
ncbi:MAG: AFG1 family ATPase [Alphaproteobacteria bacterium]|nr:AFG1 family ATPase [Alphaproteobacteria bacterium]